MVERAIWRGVGGVVSEVVFVPFAGGAAAGPAPPKAAGGEDGALPVKLPELVAALEQRYLRRALAQARFRQREAAALLGLSYDQFRGLYRKYPDALEEKTESPLPVPG